MTSLPEIHSVSSNLHTPNPLGYALHQSNFAMEKALVNALDLLRKARWSGADTRTWAQQADLGTKKSISLLRTTSMKNSLQKNLTQISDLETQIRKTIHGYMENSREMLQKIKLLNPPLSHEHIKPFIDAMEKDQVETIGKLQPLTQTLDLLAQVKEQLRDGQMPILIYSPTF